MIGESAVTIGACVIEGAVGLDKIGLGNIGFGNT